MINDKNSKINEINFDLSRVHKFKKDSIIDLSKSKILKQFCKEVWIFGSTIKGASDKKHTAFSNIDIGIYPNDITDISSQDNNNITREIYTILRKNMTIIMILYG